MWLVAWLLKWLNINKQSIYFCCSSDFLLALCTILWAFQRQLMTHLLEDNVVGSQIRSATDQYFRQKGNNEKKSLGHFWAKQTKGKILREQEQLLWYYPTALCFMMLQHRIQVGANSLLRSWKIFLSTWGGLVQNDAKKIWLFFWRSCWCFANSSK